MRMDEPKRCIVMSVGLLFFICVFCWACDTPRPTDQDADADDSQGDDSGHGDGGNDVDTGTDADEEAARADADLDADIDERSDVDGSSDADAGVCDEDPCQLIAPQCGCQVGSGCYVNTSSLRYCAPSGDVEADGRCSRLTDCVSGSSCLSLDPAIGTCQPYCEADEDCDDREGCFGLVPDVTGACSTDCDPVTGAGCASPFECVALVSLLHTGERAIGNFCARSGDLLHGAPCGSLFGECQVGHICMDGSCQELCPPDGSCSGGLSCEPFGTPWPIYSGEFWMCF